MSCAFVYVNAHFRIDANNLTCMLAVMDMQKLMIRHAELRAEALGVPMHQVCNKAGIAPSTYYRWKKGGNASLSKILKITDALSLLEVADLFSKLERSQ